MRAKNTIRITFAILAIAFFATPIAARVLGVTAEEFENRRFAQAPRASQGWDAFQQASRYLVDRMPLRAQAVRANTRIWTDVFAADPTYTRDTALADDQALPFAGSIERDGNDVRIDENGVGLRGGPTTTSTGRGGWLYVPMEFSVACDDTPSDDVSLQRWARLAQAIRADGHKTALLVAPHKASVYPEHLPRKYPHDDCALEAKERFWRTLSRDGPAVGVFELRSELLRLKRHAGDGLFQRKDMHWTTLGAITLVDAALDAVGGGVRLEANEIVDRGAVSYTGDLSVAGGRPETDTRNEYGIVRAPEATRVPGRTLVVCDSFAYKWMRLFRPYFENVRYVSWYNPADVIADAIDRADTVILEADEILFKVQAAKDELATEVRRKLAAGRP
jgi:hypothetical protein